MQPKSYYDLPPARRAALYAEMDKQVAEQLRLRSPAYQRLQEEKRLIGERIAGETRAERRKRLQMAKRRLKKKGRR